MDWLEAVERIGLAGATVVFFGFAVAWLGRRFIGKGGLLSRMGERHMQFIDKTEGLMHDSLHLQTKAMDMAAEATSDQAQTLVSTRKIRRAGLSACDVLEKIGDKLDIDLTSEVEQVRSELNGGDNINGNR